MLMETYYAVDHVLIMDIPSMLWMLFHMHVGSVLMGLSSGSCRLFALLMVGIYFMGGLGMLWLCFNLQVQNDLDHVMPHYLVEVHWNSF